MSLHKEINFENEICEHLAANGWLYEEGDATKYDRARALFPEDLLKWVQTTQSKGWDAIVKNHGKHAADSLLNRVRDQIHQRGTLDVMRRGVEMLGLKTSLLLTQPKPALAINPDIQARYAANRLRVVRQVHYSLQNENNIDLVLFLNGIPVATAELKTDFTQSIGDAIDQYRLDRDPNPKGQAAEPLLSFPNGALVHFAVSNSEVHMTTFLNGKETRFLPFNQGDNGAAGNPPNPNSGHRTAYLWEQVWERESWLEILSRYLVAQKDKKTQITKLVFPRYHQLEATRKLQAAVLADGPGGKYLIQHSAGSGKTKSIAWSAHFLADLHDAQHKKVFDSVLVVSDRTVIDSQLQEEIFDFERTAGVVATITGDGSSKSGELATALSGDKKVVVCTIQTFPFALKTVLELSATQGKRFAVIADEAHSSQTGDAAIKLNEVLSADELKDLKDGGEVSTEDILAAHMQARTKDGGITYVAFTATPKTKTMELFGTLPDPTRKPAKENLPAPFHVYSMRQAIEEGFILDVLENYTSYKLAFKLAHNGKEWDEKEVKRKAAMKGIMGWVRLHPYNISQKVEIVVEHFREFVAPLLNGKAKAMVVVGSRQEAVRWQLAMTKYIKERGYPIKSLVAFSGEVKDTESGPDPFTESSKSLNPDLKGDIRNEFDTAQYRILLVANKFQTGFDQPLLCGMYVDKRLAGIQAVQTLSRLNRAHPGKDTTYVLDFVNDTDEVLAAFKMYYETAQVSGVTDPNLVYNLKAKLDGAGHYDEFEIDRVVAVELNPNAKQSDLVKAVEPVVDRLQKKYKAAQAVLKAAKDANDANGTEAPQNEIDALLLFQSDMGSFQRLYTYLSQIFDYGNTDVEKRWIFYKQVLRLLEFGRERDGIDLSKVVLTHHNLKKLGKQPMPLNKGDKPTLPPITEVGGGIVRDDDKALLSAIIEKVNELFGADTTDGDQLSFVRSVAAKLQESTTLTKQAGSNSKEQFDNSPDLMTELTSAVIGSLDAHTSLSTQALNSKTVLEGIKKLLLGPLRLYEFLRDQSASDGSKT